MNYLDILYTPLDVPDLPIVDISCLLKWIKNNSSWQQIDSRKDYSKIVSNYPWDIIYPKTKGKWQFDFDKEFPELSAYFSSAFGVSPDDIFSVVLLPIKSEFKGVGFWHSDPDELGIRLYIENKETSDFLLIKPTVHPFGIRPRFNIDNSAIKIQEDKTHSAELLKPTQSFFINNVRAVHAVYAPEPNTLRIAVILIFKSTVETQLKKLIVDSADKFSDQVIKWTPEQLS